MRATSLPSALLVAAAALLPIAAALVPLAVPSAALAERWLRPVPGEVARPFSYARGTPFQAGAHRGADLAAPPGTPVRAACAGPVIHAGPVTGPASVVSVRCGMRRVSYLPLAGVAVRASMPVRAGTPLGTVAPGHGGLHVGVRREGDPFGYVDPLPLLGDAGPPLPASPPVRERPRRAHPRPIPAAPAPAPVPALPAPAPSLTAGRAAFPAVAPARPAAAGAIPGRAVGPAPGRPGRAPWPVWAGLALLLCGAAGSGTVVTARWRRSRPQALEAVQAMR